VEKIEAKEKGLKRYFTGIPCKNNHIADRLVNTDVCTLCLQKNNKKYKSHRAEYIKKYNKKYRTINADGIKKQRKQHRKITRNADNEYAKKYVQNKRNTDPNYKLRTNLRTRINVAIKHNQKAGSAVRDLGCSIPELKLYLEKRFTSEMSWNNWGTFWQIDHIKPLAKFNLTDREQFLEACHYSNLQPLYWEDNLIKRDAFCQYL
jgi:hypothetical protein